MDVKKEFREISRNSIKYRGVPFWSWNDRMEEGEKKSGRNFSVIPGLPDKDGYGDLVDKGLPFYAGSVIYSLKFEYSKKDADRIFLTFEKLDAIATDIKVNGKDTEPIVWKPWELDISKLMKEGENLLEIKLVNSLRNLLGPHHQKEANPIAINPASFSEELQDKYNFVPFGLTRPVKLVRKQKSIIPLLGLSFSQG